MMKPAARGLLAALALALAPAVLPAAPDAPALPDASVVVTYDMATLTPAEATRLNGERARFRVALDDSCAMQGHRGVYQVVSPDDAVATVRLPAVPDVGGALTVEATLCVIHHPARVIGATPFPPFTEYRLIDAEPAAP